LEIYAEPLQLANNAPTVDEEVASQRIEKVKGLYKKYGADKLLLEEIQDYTHKALERVEGLSLDQQGKAFLREFSNVLMKRKV